MIEAMTLALHRSRTIRISAAQADQIKNDLDAIAERHGVSLFTIARIANLVTNPRRTQPINKTAGQSLRT